MLYLVEAKARRSSGAPHSLKLEKLLRGAKGPAESVVTGFDIGDP